MKYTFLVLLVFQLLASFWFYRKQNRGEIVGGDISIPKALWLYHAIFSWYFVPLIYLYQSELDTNLAVILGVHAFIWWLRAPIELAMIFKTYNWTPRYGITHDVLHGTCLLLATLFTTRLWPSTTLNWMAYSYLIVTFFMLCFETSFAALFLTVRGDKDHKIYYASDDPKWRFINWLTTIGVTIGLAHAATQAVMAICYWP
jgi:hypothetical protein